MNDSSENEEKNIQGLMSVNNPDIVQRVQYRFEHIHALLSWVYKHNPARPKYPNILEKESKSNVEDESFFWAILIKNIERELGWFDENQQRAFRMCRLGARDRQMSAEAAAECCGVKTRTVYRWIGEIRNRLEKRFVELELIPPID